MWVKRGSYGGSERCDLLGVGCCFGVEEARDARRCLSIL